MPGCTLYTGPEVAAGAVSNAQGEVEWGFVLPPLLGWRPFLNPFLGLHFYNQALWSDPGANPAGLIATARGEGIIGR